MIYLLADVHGDLDSFIAMLNKIGFKSDKDKMIIIGDVLDRNDKSLELLELVRHHIDQGNMKLLKGNHEYFAQQYILGDLRGRTWDIYGGEMTRKQVDCLEYHKKEDLLSFITSLEYYDTIKSPKYGEMVLTHTGLQFDHIIRTKGKVDVIKSLEDGYKSDEFEFLVNTDMHILELETLRETDHFIVCGHVCTYNLNQNGESCAYINPYYMDIDCGCGHRTHGGKLCCYCVDEDIFEYI